MGREEWEWPSEADRWPTSVTNGWLATEPAASQDEVIMTLTPSPQMLKKFAGGGRGLAQVELSQDPWICIMFVFKIPKCFVFQCLEASRQSKKSNFTLGDPGDQKVEPPRADNVSFSKFKIVQIRWIL